MLRDTTEQTIVVFPLIVGCLAILLALLGKQLSRAVGLRPLSQVFETPRFRRSAAVTERLGRIALGLVGAGFVIQGLGPRFLSATVTWTLSLVLLGLCGLAVVAMVGVTLAHWNAQGH